MASSVRFLVTLVLLIMIGGNAYYFLSRSSAWPGSSSSNKHIAGAGTNGGGSSSILSRWAPQDDDSGATVRHRFGPSGDTFTSVPVSVVPREISVISSRKFVSVTVNGSIEVYNSHERGIHIVLFHPSTLRKTDASVFDTYDEASGQSKALVSYLEALPLTGRIVVAAVCDEGSYSLDEAARLALLSHLGGRTAGQLQWRSTWALISTLASTETIRNFDGNGDRDRDHDHESTKFVPLKLHAEGHNFAPSLEKWADLLKISANIVPTPIQPHCNGRLPPSVSAAQALFCASHDGYGSICSCEDDAPPAVPLAPLSAVTTSSVDIRLAHVPVAIVAGPSRPQYLLRALRALLSAEDPQRASMITVYVDGHGPEVLEVCALLGIRAVEQTPHSKKNGRIAQHYLAALTAVFEDYPRADFAIIMEEDLEAAPDFFGYFAQTLPLLQTDPTLYCISAWNDQGYAHTVGDPSAVYRVETMPGLGWLLSRRLWEGELKSKWFGPDKLWDWDMWMRMPEQRKGRECIIPDTSRTFHFGAKGLNVQQYFQDLYFSKRALCKERRVKMDLANAASAASYDTALGIAITRAQVLDHTQNPCNVEAFFPAAPLQRRRGSRRHPGSRSALVVTIAQSGSGDYDSWLILAGCWQIWDLDARGFHKDVWRLYMRGHHVIVVGSASPFFSRVSSNFDPYSNTNNNNAVLRPFTKEALEHGRAAMQTPKSSR